MIPKAERPRLLVASAVVIGIATLVPGTGGNTTTDSCIFCGDRGASDFLCNILLFAPLGFALARRGVPATWASLIGFALSVCVELAQLGVIIGRDASAGDTVANTLGTLAGWQVGLRAEWWTRRRTTSWPAVRLAVATASALSAALVLFLPSFTESTYYLQWSPEFGHMSVYPGDVHEMKIGGRSYSPGPVPETAELRAELEGTELTLSGTARQPPGFAPIASIYDHERREIMLAVADRSDFVFSRRAVADALRLDRGDIRVHRAFAHVADGAEFSLRFRYDRQGYCMEVNEVYECGVGFTAGDTWTLLLALDWGTAERAVLRFLWLALLFVPTGLLAAHLRGAVYSAGAAAVVLVVLPFLGGFAITPLNQLLAIASGVGGGAFARSKWGSCHS